MTADLEVKGSTVSFSLKDEQLVLDADRALFWPSQSLLVISDVHLGKAGHFRKHGIPVPGQVHISDFQRLNTLIQRYHPEKILFLGDLFHSDQNNEWNDFVHWSRHHHRIHQILVRGNHDILNDDQYKQLNIEICDRYDHHPFSFSHEREPTADYNISGHVHPAVRLRGLARQGATCPCFYFAQDHALMPAFGQFTGNHPLRPRQGDQVFAIAEQVLVGFVA